MYICCWGPLCWAPSGSIYCCDVVGGFRDLYVAPPPVSLCCRDVVGGFRGLYVGPPLVSYTAVML